MRRKIIAMLIFLTLLALTGMPRQKMSRQIQLDSSGYYVDTIEKVGSTFKYRIQ